MHLCPRRRRAAKRQSTSVSVALAILTLTAFIVGCGQKSVMQPDPIIARVETLLRKDVANTEDQAFITGLSSEEVNRILAYYTEHPRDTAESDKGPVVPLSARSEIEPNSASATAWTGETIECTSGFGGWIASGWFHTSLCGGDTDDHFYYYPGVPSAYSSPWALKGRSIHPAVLLVLKTYDWKLSARVYANNDVFICVGSRMHLFGLTHEAWRTSFNLYRG